MIDRSDRLWPDADKDQGPVLIRSGSYGDNEVSAGAAGSCDPERGLLLWAAVPPPPAAADGPLLG